MSNLNPPRSMGAQRVEERNQGNVHGEIQSTRSPPRPTTSPEIQIVVVINPIPNPTTRDALWMERSEDPARPSSPDILVIHHNAAAVLYWNESFVGDCQLGKVLSQFAHELVAPVPGFLGLCLACFHILVTSQPLNSIRPQFQSNFVSKD